MWSKSCEILDIYDVIAEDRCSDYMYALVEDENRYAVVWYFNGKLYGRYLDDPEYYLRSFDSAKGYLKKSKWSPKLAVLIAKFRIYDWWQRR